MIWSFAVVPFLGMVASISVTQFGVVPGSTADATEAVARAIAAAKGRSATIEFPAGDYHFYREQARDRELSLSNSDAESPRKVSILVEGQQGLRLHGRGARLLFHDRVIPFAILDSRDIVLDGFTVDWPRPLMSQATVLEYDASGMTLQVDSSQYPYSVENGELHFTDSTWKRKAWGMMEFDAQTKGIAYRTGDSGFTDGDWRSAKVVEREPGRLRLDFSSTRGPKVGNILAIRHGVRDHAGTFIEGSKNVTLTNMAYRHTSGLGVLSQFSENLTFKNVEMAPDPGSGRLFAGHDDGFHFSNCKGKILVEDCLFEGLMDDPINVHGTSVRIVEVLGDRTLKARFMHPQSVGMHFGEVGDAVSMLDRETLLPRATAKTRALRPLSAQEFEIEFDRPVPASLVAGDALENLTWTPAVTIRRSTFGTVRARGLLVSTPKKVVVEDCTFRSSGAAILIAGDANQWFESGAVKDVTIRRNRFENCNTSPYQFCDAVISIHPEIPILGDAPFHRGITIADNTFVAFDAPLLWATSVGRLRFVRNRIEASSSYEPLHPNRDGLTFIGCEDVLVEDNKVGSTFPGRTVKIEGGKPDTVRIVGWP